MFFKALREKERCDWRMLCCEEKKALYRASFCQTFAEFQAPTGQWKFIFGWVFIITSFAFWMAMFYHYYGTILFILRYIFIYYINHVQSSPVELIIFIVFNLSINKSKRGVKFRDSTPNISKCRVWGTECLNTLFFLPTVPSAYLAKSGLQREGKIYILR